MSNYNVYVTNDDGSRDLVKTVEAKSEQAAISIVCDEYRCNETYITAEKAEK